MATILERIDSKGKKTYQAKIRIKGYPTQSKTFERKTDAKLWANKMEHEIRTGIYLPEKHSNQHTLAELIERYCANEINERKSDIGKVKMHLQWWKKELGAYYLNRLTPAIICDARSKLANENKLKPRSFKEPLVSDEKRSNSTVNRYMSSLSTVLNVAVNEYGWLQVNPAHLTRRKTENNSRERSLTDVEMYRLLNCAEKISKELLLCVKIALSTGGRYSEIRNLKWADINFRKNYLIYYHTKNGTNRVVPLTSELKSELLSYKKVRNINSDYLFATADGLKLIDLREQFNKALEKAKIENFRFHDMRHTASTRLAESGATPLDIAAILGHKTLQMVQRYTHISDDHLADVLSKMNKELFSEDISKAE